MQVFCSDVRRWLPVTYPPAPRYQSDGMPVLRQLARGARGVILVNGSIRHGGCTARKRQLSSHDAPATQLARAHIFGGPFGGDVGSGSAGFDVGVEGSSTRSRFVMRVPLPFSFSVRAFQHSEQMSYSLSPICRFEHSLHWSHRSQTIMALPLSGHLREQWAISRTDPITGNPTFALRFRSTSLVTIQLTVARFPSK